MIIVVVGGDIDIAVVEVVIWDVPVAVAWISKRLPKLETCEPTSCQSQSHE